MAQFIVYENNNSSTRKTYPYLLDIQSDLLEALKTTVVIPLCPAAVGEPAITRLCPVLNINGKNYIALTQQLAGIDKKSLEKEACNLSSCRTEIIAALGFLVSGI